MEFISYVYTVIRDNNLNPFKMKKFKVQIAGESYEVSEKSFRSQNGKQYFYISHAEAGSLVKQFCKKFFPQYVCRVSSSSFAGGNSLDVYMCTKNGGPIPTSAFSAVSDFANQFEYGKFNGMYDIYEDYEDSGVVTDKGTELKAGVKYVHCNNRASWGTVEAILNEILNEGRTYAEVVKWYTSPTSKKAAEKAKLMLNL